MNNNLIPFDLSRAIAGDPLCTRDGREVTEFKYFETCNEAQPIVAAIAGSIENYYIDGIWLHDRKESNSDLFLAPVLTERWQNVYQGYQDTPYVPKHKTKEGADDEARGHPNFTRTHYLVTYWGEDGVVVPELSKWIEIKE